MRKLVFVTNNAHKLQEIRAILGSEVEVLSLADLGCTDEIPETATTLEGNALLKARYIYDKYGLDCFADDTGLEVRALGGAPGVYSARYAGSQCSAADNMDKLLKALEGQSDRTAAFRTVIALIEGGVEHLFEGTIGGAITTEPRGASGFGYDPVFCPEGYSGTFAELGSEVKNEISHRAVAVQRLTQHLTGR